MLEGSIHLFGHMTVQNNGRGRGPPLGARNPPSSRGKRFTGLFFFRPDLNKQSHWHAFFIPT